MFGRQVEDADTLDVELFHDVADDGEHDIDLGAARPKPSGHWWLVLGGIGAAVLLVIVATTIGRDSNEAAVTETSLSTSTSSGTGTTTAPSRTTAEPSRRSTTTTINPLTAEAPLLDTDQPWSIFVIDQNNGRTRRIDVQTGEIETLAGNATSYVVTPQASFPVPSSGSQGVQGLLPAGPEYGTFWNMDFAVDGQTLALMRVLPGSEVEEVRQVPLALNEYLLGSTAAGDPVIYGPDGDAYTIAPDRTRQKFSPGRVSGVQNGFYTEVLCDDVAVCRNVIHGAAVVEEPYTEDLAATFSPSGMWVALNVQNFRGGGEPVQLRNLLTGQQYDVEGPFIPSYFGFGGASALAFTPDERWAVGISGPSLVTIDLTTGESTIRSLPEGVDNAQLAVNAVL